jgi:hypothetical protein
MQKSHLRRFMYLKPDHTYISKTYNLVAFMGFHSALLCSSSTESVNLVDTLDDLSV